LTYANDLYSEIRVVLQQRDQPAYAYRLLWRLLDRMLKERTENDEVEYFGLAPRIHALCSRYGISHQSLSILYSNSLRANKGEFVPDEEDLLYDVKALCQAIQAFYDTPSPIDILAQLPEKWRSWEGEVHYSDICIRLTVKEWDEEFVYGFDINDPSQRLLKVAHDKIWNLSGQLYPLATLNLLDVNQDENGILIPRLIILSPDYLVDITTICQCFKGSGASPMFYLLNKFMPKGDSLDIQLGNAANQFLDDVVNHSGTYLDSMQKNFKDYPLKYTTLQGVDKHFFDQCKQQYENIKTAVENLFPEAGINIDKDEIQLEPAFMCERLGIQGRFDLLANNHEPSIVELKSGKQDEFHNTFRLEHALQMALYKEILHYSLGLPRNKVQTLLFYSRYPLLHDIRLGQEYIIEAMALRNAIVHIDRMLRTNCHDFLRSVKEEDFNPQNNQGKLYVNFIKPGIERFLNIIHEATPLEYDYFCTMTEFVEREQSLAKMGDDRPDSDRGFAQAWLCDTENKRLHGSIITDLTLKPVVDERGLLTHVESFFANEAETDFREGDSVTLYERNSEQDVMTNRQSVRCTIEELHADHMLLRINHPGRNAAILKSESRYAIESSYSDSIFNTMYRGLFALLSCPIDRRNLILGLRQPTPKDYFLLVGPPGSGKTSMALRKMVEEHLRDEASDSILLMAYTNRAVDEICQMLIHLPDSPDFIRIGQESSCAQEYRPRLLRNFIGACVNRQQLQEKIQPIRIICGTVASLSGASEIFQLWKVKTAILDEASQVLEPQLMPLLTSVRADGKPAIERFVMIGDHKQLPAVVVQHPSRSKVVSEALQSMGLLNCRDSLFERFHRLAQSSGNTHVCGMLTHQGRMHQVISSFVSENYYNQKLEVVPLPHQIEDVCWPIFDATNPEQSYLATRRMGVFDILPDSGENNNKANRNEAECIARLVGYLYNLSVLNQQIWEPARQIGIIVPFRAQISMIRQALRRQDIPEAEAITVDTVERYQGSQREVILFSTVIRQNYQLEMLSTPVQEDDGTSVDRKLNVAITRARRQFFLVGNLSLLRQAPDYEHLIAYAER